MFKKLDSLVFRSFVGPFITGFLIVLFVLVIQFLSRYIEDLFGKDVDGMVLLKVFAYCSMFLFTMALPLSILFSSLMTMGNMGEQYELAALKSAGISLFSILRPMIVFTLLATGVSMYFSFYVSPKANLKFFSLLYDLSKVKPSFALKEGHFYSGIDGFTIHSAKIDRQKDMLYNVKIYDHSNKKQKGFSKVIVADSARMFGEESKRVISMQLFHGVTHEEFIPKKGKDKGMQYGRFYFDTLNYHFILSGFDLESSNQMNFSPHQLMKNIEELEEAVDSMNQKVKGNYLRLSDYIIPVLKTDSTTASLIPRQFNRIDCESDILSQFPAELRMDILSKAINNARTIQNYSKFTHERVQEDRKRGRRYAIEYWYRIMLPVSCLVFLLIGAPMGAIVRKGGLGVPVIFSLIFFIIFYLFMVQGKKLAQNDILSPFMGVFLPIFAILPAAIALTYQSATDSPILDINMWKRGFQRVWEKIKGKKNKYV